MARTALLLALLAALLLAPKAASDEENIIASITTVEDVDLDEECESPAFMIVVEHEDEWRCGGSLLSQRTALTTARCALGPRGGSVGELERELWALAIALLSARPAPSSAAAARRVRRIALSTVMRPAPDLALLELERPFSATAHTRPILLATSRGECERVRQCNAIRAVVARQRRRLRLRVANVTRVEEARCAGRVPWWSTAAQRLVCYVGDELCENDLGGGVVCEGKLCAVLGDTVATDAARCSDTYVALAVPHWQRFLRCAHTGRLCGRGDCAKLCTEQSLVRYDGGNIDNDTQVDGNSEASWNERDQFVTSSSLESNTNSVPAPTASSIHPDWHSLSSLESTSVVALIGRSMVFEPNRADFKVTPSRTTMVRLKAGEYGDNAAEYESDDESPPPPRTAASASAGTPPTAAPEPPALERRMPPPARSLATSINARWSLHLRFSVM